MMKVLDKEWLDGVERDAQGLPAHEAPPLREYLEILVGEVRSLAEVKRLACELAAIHLNDRDELGVIANRLWELLPSEAAKY